MARKVSQIHRDDESKIWIDRDMLDTEWEKHSERFFKASKDLASAVLDLDEAESELELAVAEIDKDIRDSPEAYDIDDKVTEERIKKTIPLQKQYQEANTAVTNAKFNVNLIKALVNAMHHRKAALENLVDLEALNYKSEPYAKSQSARERLDEKRERRLYKKGQKKRKRKEEDEEDDD